MEVPAESVSLGHGGPILFYDGECGFCNGSVRFVLRHEAMPIMRFSPLQGVTAAKMLPQSGLPENLNSGSIVLFETGKFYIRSRAAARTMQHMGGPWKAVAFLLRLIPAPLADVGYRIIAKIRYHLPQGLSCELLPPDQRQRFLP